MNSHIKNIILYGSVSQMCRHSLLFKIMFSRENHTESRILIISDTVTTSHYYITYSKYENCRKTVFLLRKTRHEEQDIWEMCEYILCTKQNVISYVFDTNLHKQTYI